MWCSLLCQEHQYLVTISECIKFKERENALDLISDLHTTYKHTVQNLINDTTLKLEVEAYVNTIFATLKEAAIANYSSLLSNKIIAQGELLSTFIFSRFLKQEGLKACLLPALEFMRIDKFNEPDNFYIRQNFNRIVENQPDADIYITQGFICLDADGQIANLQRGGSDYTATIIGAALKAKEVQIWTDIDGFHNNDPRFVPDTHAISNLSFDEAAELAYLGAKILHPSNVTPVKELDIPVRLKNTMSPSSHGNLITNAIHGEGLKRIGRKDGITAIKLTPAKALSHVS